MRLSALYSQCCDVEGINSRLTEFKVGIVIDGILVRVEFPWGHDIQKEIRNCEDFSLPSLAGITSNFEFSSSIYGGGSILP